MPDKVEVSAFQIQGKTRAAQFPYNVTCPPYTAVQWESSQKRTFDVSFPDEKGWPFKDAYQPKIEADAGGRTASFTVDDSKSGYFPYKLSVTLKGDQDQINPIIIIDPHQVNGSMAYGTGVLIGTVAAVAGFIAGYIVGSS